jgi:hypothetical protein
MNIDAPRLAGGHPDRDIHCQESLPRVMQQIIGDATMQGWGTIETINAMDEILMSGPRWSPTISPSSPASSRADARDPAAFTAHPASHGRYPMPHYRKITLRAITAWPWAVTLPKNTLQRPRNL